MQIQLWPSEKGKRADSAFFKLDIDPDTLDSLMGTTGVINTRFTNTSTTGLSANGRQRLRVASPVMLYTIAQSKRKRNPDMAAIADVLRDGQDMEWEIRLDLFQGQREEKPDEEPETIIFGLHEEL